MTAAKRISNSVIGICDALFTVFLSSYAYLLLRNLSYPSLVWDEAVICQSGVDIARLAPSFLNDPVPTVTRYVKWYPYFPPFFSLLLAVSYVLFGVSELSARMVSVIFSLGCLVSTYLFGRKHFGETAGLIASVFLSLSPIYWNMSRIAMLDAASVFFFYVTMYLFYDGYTQDRPGLLLLSGATLGLGFLVKYSNILCVLVAAAFILTDQAISGNRLILKKALCLALALELAFFIVLPWVYFATTLSRRWTGWAHEIEPGKQYKWLMPEYWHGSAAVIWPQLTVPVAVVALLGTLYLARSKRRQDCFLLCWAAVVFLWFVPIHKDLRYTMPYLPALTLAAAKPIEHASQILRKQFAASSAPELGEQTANLRLPLALCLALLLALPGLHNIVTEPRGFRAPLYETFKYVTDHLEPGGNVVLLLPCNNVSQHAAYFYANMAGGLDVDVHIHMYPRRSVDWYDPGPLNSTELYEVCVDYEAHFVVVWEGSPYADSWLPALKDYENFRLDAKIGEEGNQAYVFSVLS